MLALHALASFKVATPVGYHPPLVASQSLAGASPFALPKPSPAAPAVSQSATPAVGASQEPAAGSSEEPVVVAGAPASQAAPPHPPSPPSPTPPPPSSALGFGQRFSPWPSAPCQPRNSNRPTHHSHSWQLWHLTLLQSLGLRGCGHSLCR